MVKVFLRGGLGNQMFQYALGLSLAQKNNTELVLDTVFLNDRFPRKQFTYRTYDLDIFDIKPKFTLLSKISARVPIPGLWLGLDLCSIKFFNFLNIEKIIKEKRDHIFDPGIMENKGDIILWGRWQNEEYFRNATQALRNSFSFRHSFEGDAEEIAKQISSSQSISLHIRRGDFGSLESVVSLMGKTNINYYAKAVEYISQKISSPHFFIFSDDIEWCKQNIKFDFPVVYVPASVAGPKASFHLQLMSLCKHNIIANSTFSWWGAWLNQNPDKIIIAPQKWYNNSSSAEGMVPAAWIKL